MSIRQPGIFRRNKFNVLEGKCNDSDGKLSNSTKEEQRTYYIL